MQQALMAYFAGEKQAALFLLGAGLAGLAAAAVVAQPRWDLRTLAVTMGAFALVQIAIGAGLYLRTGPQVELLRELMWNDPQAACANELVRMIRVQQRFLIVEAVWLVLLAAAPIAAVVFKHHFHVSGIALGVVLNAALFLAFDLVAERRGAAYLATLAATRSSHEIGHQPEGVRPARRANRSTDAAALGTA